MSASAPSSMRKRKRTRLTDNEVDELSPQKENTPIPLSASQKKRKLDTQISSPAAGGLLGFGRRISGLLGVGDRTGKENLDDAEEEDELTSGKHSFEVEDSDADVSKATKANGRPAKMSSLRKTERKRRVLSPMPQSSGKTGSKDTEVDIYEVTVSDEDETGTPASLSREGQEKLERTKSLLKEKRSPGRPRKSDILRKDKLLSREATRRRIAAENGPAENEETTQTSGARKADHNTGFLDHVDAPPDGTPRRGRPKKMIDEALDVIRPVPKGILTPRKRRVGTPRKIVAFQGEGTELDLGFKDLPSASSKKPKGKESLMPIENVANVDENSSLADNDREEDVACSVCGKLDSKRGNQILLCDGCDKAVHQGCCDVPVIPEGDWFCKDCVPDAVDEPEVKFEQGSVAVDIQGEISNIENFEHHLRAAQRIVLDRLTGQRQIRLNSHDEQMQKVHQLIEQSVLAGEGNSMLVIGGRASGKTTLVEAVISDISSEHRDKFHVVRLNGFIHTDDKIALREIWQQLGREMEVGEDLTSKGNHADTLASLLALLSHPSELADSQDVQSEQTTKSVVFVLDEFDLFTNHARQTLLYNLFDIAQARKAPIAVLGLTTRIEVVESLEKRVKSRFSHRYVYLPSPRNIPAFWEVCREALIIEARAFDVDGDYLPSAGRDKFVSFWQGMINDLYNDKAFKDSLQSCYYRSKSVPAFLTSCIIPIANLSVNQFPLTGKAFGPNSVILSPPDSKLHVLQGLSDLELALLISAARLDIILDTETCNFAMAYDEYSSLTSKHKIQTSSTGVAAIGASAKVWGRNAALGAWERLADYDLLISAGISSGSTRDIGVGGRMWKVDVGLEEIVGSVDNLSGIMAKWCREI